MNTVENMKKTIFSLIALILFVAIAVVVVLNYQSQTTPAGINDKNCGSDTDCAIVAPLDPSNTCCETCGAEAINKQAEIKRNERYAENCGGVECPAYDCYSEKLPKPKCVNNQCEIEWIERTE